MKTIPLIRAKYAQPFIAVGQRAGLSVHELCQLSGLPESALDDPELLIPERPIWRILNHLRADKGIEDAGFQAAHGVSMHLTPGLLEQLLDANNLRELLLKFCIKVNTQANTSSYGLHEAASQVEFRRRRTPFAGRNWPMEQCVVMVMLQIVRSVAGEDWQPSAISLYREIELTQRERSWLGATELRLGCDRTALWFDPDILDLPVDLSVHVRDAGQYHHSAERLLDGLEESLENYIEQGVTSLEDFSRFVGMHPRMVQRHLKRKGTSFQLLLDKVRFRMARSMLATGEFNQQQIARALAYRSPAAFTRAFSRWAGCPPSRF